MRINKFLAECGICSRRNADELVREGRVSINKKVVRELGFDVDENKDVVFVDGKKIQHITHYDYVLFYKPKGCVTTASDEFDRKTIYDYLKTDKRLFPVGRLDFDSEGLLLMTNDGELANKLMHPKNEIAKSYIVKIEGEIQESDLAILRKGVKFEGVQYGRSKIKITGIENNLTRLEVIIFEGKNREIRKMFKAVEKNVVFLKRVAIADLKLGGLSRGGQRDLNEFEIAYLKKLTKNMQ